MTNSLTAVDVFLGISILVSVGITMFARARTSQVMAFLGLGIVLSLVWFRLSSLDIGLAEAALGSGILSVVLVALAATGVSQRAQTTEQQGQRDAMPRWVGLSLGVTCGMVLTVAIASIWWRLEQQMPLWESDIDAAMSELPVDHGITGVLLSFRAYDTLLESAVLMFAALLALAMMPQGSLRTAAEQPRKAPKLSDKYSFSWAFRLLAPILLLLGLWILFAGTSEPGGAFQAGAVIVGMLILLHVAEVRLDHFIRYWMVPLVVSGVCVFVVASALGPLMSDTWFTWPPTIAYAVIVIIEVGLTIGIAAALFLLYLAVLQPAERFTQQSASTTQGANS